MKCNCQSDLRAQGNYTDSAAGGAYGHITELLSSTVNISSLNKAEAA